MYLKARAKVNLTLNVLNKREDGYHNLESIFQKINLYDEMWVEKDNTDKLILESNIKNVTVEENIIYKAYVLLKNEFPNITGVKVKLNKKIPMQAGLAGGSTDCASFIIAMNDIFNLNMSKDKLKSIASKLGADVVPCMYNKAVKARGIGEIITEINTNFKYYFVIIKPNISLSTKEMYEKIDNKKVNNLNNTENMIKALKQNNVIAISNNLFNSFEEVTIDEEKIINAKNALISNGAINSLLAGSGSCVFGIFENKVLAKKAYDKLKNQYEVYICTSYNSRRKNFGKE